MNNICHYLRKRIHVLVDVSVDTYIYVDSELLKFILLTFRYGPT